MNPQELWLKQTISADRVRRPLTSEWRPVNERSRLTRRMWHHRLDDEL